MSSGESKTREQVRAAVLEALAAIAPEVDAATIDPTARLRDQFELDSMDFLNFLIAVSREVGVEIPEADYGRITTLEGMVEYLVAHQQPWGSKAR